jgi:RNA polymerase sigma-70 factor (ECF subfamily)
MGNLTETDLRKWMTEFGPSLVTLSAGICRDRHQAEEVVQEAFIRLWKSPPDAGVIAYRSWLRTVVTNLSINALKRIRRPGALPEFSDDPSMKSGRRAQDIGAERDEMDRLRDAMDRLDPAKRAILMLRAVEGLSYDQIANHLGVPIGTVMSRLNRARAALAEAMADSDEAPANDENGSSRPLPFPRSGTA